jgi:predicted site-specific integrase-resolvase
MTDFAAMVGGYPELLRWRHLCLILGYSRRTLERWREQGKLNGIEFVDISGVGNLMATRSSVIQFLESRKRTTGQVHEMPPLSIMRM